MSGSRFCAEIDARPAADEFWGWGSPNPYRDHPDLRGAAAAIARDRSVGMGPEGRLAIRLQEKLLIERQMV